MSNESRREQLVRARGSARGIAERYSAELTIALLGALAGAAEAVFADEVDIALLVVLISWFLALAVAVIRQDIASELRAASVEARLIDAIPDARWRKVAADRLDRQRAEFTSWAVGTRRVAEGSSLNYQIELVKSARRSICAVHLALDDDSLRMWADPQRGFDRLVDAYRGLPDGVRCRRVLVLDEASSISAQDGDQRHIIEPEAQEVCRTQVRARADGGLEFELRVTWIAKSDRRIANLLVVDEREACTIESYGRGRFSDLEASVNQAVVQSHLQSFEDLWTDSVPVDRCLSSG